MSDPVQPIEYPPRARTALAYLEHADRIEFPREVAGLAIAGRCLTPDECACRTAATQLLRGYFDGRIELDTTTYVPIERPASLESTGVVVSMPPVPDPEAPE